MTNLPIKPGIDGLPTSSIPSDPNDFVDWFKNSFIPRWAANADIRNAIPGAGVQIGGTSDTPGFVGFEEIAGTSVLGNPTGTTGDVQAITASANGQFLQRADGALVFAAFAVADSITGSGTAAAPLELVNDSEIPGNTQYYGTDSSGNRGFHSIPASSSNVTTLTQAGGASQTYNLPATANTIAVLCIGGGGGGGSGMHFGSGTETGGGGGGGGGMSYALFRASDLGTSIAVTFSNSATGGNGAPPVTGTATGANGVAGSNVNFGNRLMVTGGAFGGGGASGSAGGIGGIGNISAGTTGGAGGTGVSASGVGTAQGAQGASTVSITAYGNTGGGGGAGATIGVATTGGAGGAGTQFLTLSAGAAGSIGGNGGPGVNGGGMQPASGGGGGGSGITTTSGGNGGNGGTFGGGGGGGGSSYNTSTQSGGGGNGGVAACVIFAF